MASRANAVKSAVKNDSDIETVVLDDEENGPVSHKGPDMIPNLSVAR